MAPNLVTLTGLGFIIINTILLFIYDPYLTKEVPYWVYWVWAFNLFMYQTFDGCDGIHARRTGQSGPLGELFDHSIDAINTTLCCLVFCSMLNTGYSFGAMYNQFTVLCNFYLSTWEEYHTGILFLSEISGPVEGVLGVCLSLVATGILGPELLWHTKLFTFKGFYGNEIIFETSTFYLIILSFGLLFNILLAKDHVFEHYDAKNEKNKDVSKEKDNAMNGLSPFIVYYTSVVLIITLEPDFVSFSFIMSIGLIMAFVVGRIIVNHLTKQEFPFVNKVMGLHVLQLILYFILVPILGHPSKIVIKSLSWVGLGLSLGVHAMFINEIIYEFTTYLDVYALRIKHPKVI